MKTRSILAWGLVALLSLTGCGQEEESGSGTISGAQPKAAKIANDLVSLIPSDTAALAYVGNAQDFEAKLRGMVRQFDDEASQEMRLLDGLGEMLGPVAPHWDTTRPLAFAIPTPPPGRPDPEKAMQGAVLIFAVKDMAAATAEFEKMPAERRPSFKTSGSYLAMTMGPTGSVPKWSGNAPAFARQVPEADLGMRIDLAALVTRYRPDIEDGLVEMEREMSREVRGSDGKQTQGMLSMLSGVSEWARDFVDSAELLEVGINLGNTTAGVSFAFVAKDGSKLDVSSHDHGSLAKIAGFLPGDMPLSILLSLDMQKLMEWMEPLFDTVVEAMPDDQRAGFRKYLTDATALYKDVGPDWGMAMGLGKRGIEFVQVTDVKDGDGFIKRMSAMLEGDAIKSIPGVTVKKSDPTEMAGVQVHAFELSLDVEALGGGRKMRADQREEIESAMERVLGGSSLKMSLAVIGDKLLFVMGGKARVISAIEQVKSGGGKPSSAMQAAIEAAGGTPTFLLQIDARMLMRQIASMVREVSDEDMPSPAEGTPIPVVIYAKHDGRVYGGGFSVDVAGIAELVDLFR